MKTRGFSRAILVLALILTCYYVGCSRGGEYPDREIRLIVQAAPGGISDSVSRYVSKSLQEELGVPVIAENRSGAAGSVAFSYVARSRPDGYTIGYAPVDLTIVHHLGYSDVTPSDFDFLVMHTKAPACLAVSKNGPWKDLDDFVRDARSASSSISMATAGTGSIWHMAALAFANKANIKFTYVPFPGSAPAVTALLGGHVHAVVAGPSEVHPHVEAGNLKVLGVMSEDPSSLFPSTPTFQAQGYDTIFAAWGGFLAPNGLDPAVRDKLVTGLSKVVQSDGFRQFCKERGLELAYLQGEEFKEFVQEEFKTYGNLVKQAGLGQEIVRSQ